MKTKLFLSVILILLCRPYAFAENAKTLQTQPTKQAEIIPAPEKSPVIDKIERLMRMDEYDRAAELAEIYLKQQPENSYLKSLLAACYEGSRNFEKLVQLMDKRLAEEPRGFALLRTAGRAYLLAGKTDSARILFYEAANYARKREGSLKLVTNSYINHGFYDLALEFIDSMRVLTNTSDLLCGPRGDALVAKQQYGEATLEYLSYMERDSTSAIEGENRILSMIRYKGSVDTVMAILSKRIKDQVGSRRIANTYGRLLLEQDRFDEARLFYQEVDSLKNHQGGDILYFIRECNKRHKYQQTLLAGQYMLDNYPKSPWTESIKFAMADAYTQLSQYDKALNLYDDISSRFTRSTYKAEVNLRIGLLYKDYIRDTKQAFDYLSTAIATSPGSRFATQARFALADLYVKQRQFDSASAIYENLLKKDLSDDFSEKISFILAQISLFQGKFEDAEKHFRRIISHYPRGFYVNDAIQYILIMGEASETAKKQMDLFSNAEYYRYIQEQDSLEFYLNKICLVGIPALAPISYVRLAKLYTEQGDTADAVSAIDSLNSKFPESYFLPYGLRIKADILLATNRQKEAMAIYRSLLEKYPRYPFAAEIRNILRKVTESEQT